MRPSAAGALVTFILLAGLARGGLAQTLPPSFVPAVGGIWINDDCSRIAADVGAFGEWKKRFREHSPAFDPESVTRLADGRCRTRVDSFLPSVVSRLHSRISPNEGPNCFNAALVLAGLLPELRFTDELELRFWLESPLCRKLPASEESEPGDFVLIREKAKGRIRDKHGYLFVNDEFVFSKNGRKEDSPYLVQRRADVRKTYGSKSSFEETYRCVPFDEYLSRARELSLDYRAALESARRMECEVSQVVLGGRPLEAEGLQRMREALLLLRELIRSNFRSHPDGTPTSELERVLWQALEHQVDSMRMQVGKLGRP